MSEQDTQKTNEPEVKEVPEPTKEDQGQPKEDTIGDVLDQKPAPAKAPAKPESVPIDVFLDMKKENKALAKSVKELQRLVKEGASQEDIDDQLDDLEAEGLDSKKLQALTKRIRSEYRSEMEEELNNRLKPLEEKERQIDIDRKFKKHFSNAMNNLPEYEGVVDEDLIKDLSLLPKNANKTFTQLIQDTYKNVSSGKRPIESNKPRGGKDAGPVDANRMKSDQNYYKEVMADPEAKKEYNKGLIQRLTDQGVL